MWLKAGLSFFFYGPESFKFGKERSLVGGLPANPPAAAADIQMSAPNRQQSNAGEKEACACRWSANKKTDTIFH